MAILVGENIEYAAEVPFTLPLESDPLSGLTGHSFVLGEVRIMLPGGGWQDATLAKIVEKGYGRYAVRLTSAQTQVSGNVYVRADVPGAQPFFGYEVIGYSLGGDLVQGSSGSLPFFLPNATDPVYGVPLSGVFNGLAGRVIRICLPDGVYQDADPTLVTEIGYGAYALSVTALQTANRGKVFLYAYADGAQRFEGYYSIVAAGVSVGPPAPPGPTPIPVPVTPSDPEYVNQLSAALNRLPQQFRSGDFDYGSRTTAVVTPAVVIDTFTPVPIEYEVVVPTISAPEVTNHLARGLDRLPQQFRSGTIVYAQLEPDTTPQDIAGPYVPAIPEYDIPIPVVTDPDTTAHLVAALSRLPHQFRSGDTLYGGATLNSILDAGV